MAPRSTRRSRSSFPILGLLALVPVLTLVGVMETFLLAVVALAGTIEPSSLAGPVPVTSRVAAIPVRHARRLVPPGAGIGSGLLTSPLLLQHILPGLCMVLKVLSELVQRGALVGARFGGDVVHAFRSGQWVETSVHQRILMLVKFL